MTKEPFEIEKKVRPGFHVASGLTMEEEKFCQAFVSKDFFGNGIQSYIEVHPNVKYGSAATASRKLLVRTDITDRINALLDEAGLNDNFVDKQLLIMITQNADYSAKIQAIREYNKLRQRIIEKVDLTSQGNAVSQNVTYNVIINGKIKDE